MMTFLLTIIGSGNAMFGLKVLVQRVSDAGTHLSRAASRVSVGGQAKSAVVPTLQDN